MVTRRRLIQIGISSIGTLTLFYTNYNFGAKGKGSSDDDNIASPATTPFKDALPLPFPPLDVGNQHQLDVPANARHFEMIEEQAMVSMHSDLPETSIWRYRDTNVEPSNATALGPIFMVKMGADKQPICVRFNNHLPIDHKGFGLTHTTVHFHGGHIESRSDGFPEDIDNLGFHPIFERGGFYDYRYDMEDPGYSTDEVHSFDRPSTLWYHDHFFDFTGPNVYRGLVGFFLIFDELDTGDENDTSGLQLPSGEFDLPLAFQDKQFARDGSLLYNSFDHNGFLGDKFLVNGMIQPFHRVQRRKYRIRLLNGSNARFYQLFITDKDRNTYPFDIIATDGGLFSSPIRGRESILLGSAERREIIFDFSQFEAGTVIFIENRLRQEDGRGPKGDFLRPDTPNKGPRLLKFIVEGGDVEDNSLVPNSLRPFDPISKAELKRAKVSEFEFDKKQGAWTINGKLADLSRPMVSPVMNQPVIWRFINKSGGWWHPIHVHLEFMRVISRNGKRPPLEERDGMARKDTIILGPNDEVEVFIKFRDYPGPWVFHCHNLEHEDMRMMARFDVKPEE